MKKNKKETKEPLPAPTAPDCRESLGLAPAVLAKREIIPIKPWCPAPPSIEFDQYCNPHHPVTIHYSHVKQADEVLKHIIQSTPLLKSKRCDKFDMELYFKVETVHQTGSFHERSAIFALYMLTDEQRLGGVVTASSGNWGLALSYQGHKMKVHVTVVFPTYVHKEIIQQCKSYGGIVILHGKSFAEAKKHAFTWRAEQGGSATYINGYDHPHVIAGAGSIGIEILEQLPTADAILVPIGGGGLIAGISTLTKHVKPELQIYVKGVEPGKSCNFFKALDNELPYEIASEVGLATTLAVPKAGDNAFHTARSLIDKMVLVHDDWTSRAILHLAEEEALIAEGAGAISLGALLCMPDILPELHGKKVVCIVSGGNIDVMPLTRIFTRGKAVEGRLVTLTVHVTPGKEMELGRILKVISHLKCNVHHTDFEREWLTEDKIMENYVTIVCETNGMKHAWTLKHVIDKFFPNMCEFDAQTFEPKITCACFPRRIL